MKIVPAAEIDAAEQDALVERAPMATFLHSRRYLAYHGDRFRDASLTLFTSEGELAGLFPAAVDPEDQQLVVSHPGLSYGGILHAGRLRGERMVEALEAICLHYADQGFLRLRYKTVPHIYSRMPSGDDLYALFRRDARRYRCDLLNTIDLVNRPAPSSRRRRSLKKACATGMHILEGAELLPQLWPVLAENLARRHGVAPVHSVEEILHLHGQFPEQIQCVVAMLDEEVLAGVVLFVMHRVVHAQYIAASSLGQQISALDLVFEHCITRAAEQGARYFDFGSSTEQGGWRLNEGLFQFKSEFGAGAIAHEFYELDLPASA
jgi:hypothetical protein